MLGVAFIISWTNNNEGATRPHTPSLNLLLPWSVVRSPAVDEQEMNYVLNWSATAVCSPAVNEQVLNWSATTVRSPALNK